MSLRGNDRHWVRVAPEKFERVASAKTLCWTMKDLDATTWKRRYLLTLKQKEWYVKNLLASFLLILSGCGTTNVALEPSASVSTLRICDADGVSTDRTETSVDLAVGRVCAHESALWQLRLQEINASGIRAFVFSGALEGMEFPFGEPSFACMESVFHDANSWSRRICGAWTVDCRESVALPCD